MWQTLTIDEIKRNLKTNQEYGLSHQEAKKRLLENGENKLEEKKKTSMFIRFLEQFHDFMIIILLLASIISAGMAYIEKTGEYVDSIIIVAIVVFNALMGLIQEYKAEKSLEALAKMTAPVAKVRREGKIIEIPSSQIVIGDIVILETGNFVPADIRLTKTYDLQIEEAALTGENHPILKNANAILKEKVPTGDMVNMAFATTVIIAGHGEGIVCNTGMKTKVGQIAKLILTDSSPETPLQIKLGEVGKKLGLVALFICLLIFFIGIIKKIPVGQMFMTSVGLAVAAIPEGLPAIVTIMLSIGVTKMAKKRAIIRKLPAVETLGSSQIICSDKTGTLTQNKMKVVQITNCNEAIPNSIVNNQFILELGAMCNNSSIKYENGKFVAYGNPTESAIANAGLENNITQEELCRKMPRLKEIPFESTRKLMTTIHKLGNKYRVITKGAPDFLLNRCTNYYEKNQNILLDLTKRQQINKVNNNMASNALRVIGVAYKDLDYLPSRIDSNTIETNLTFVGLIGMIDPPREGVKEAIQTCYRAGIKTVMITGDHIETASAIAKELNILKSGSIAITGEQLDNIPQEKLEKEIMNYSVFARVSPEHKVRIVKAFQKNGKVVAMTGDGVNDAPALKNADIGVSMGRGGTDVAKNASDMILADDNFVTIVEAVKEGRHIFENIKKAIHFLLATNIGEIVTIFVGLLLGYDAPLIAIQLLWINLVTDSLPAIALGLEPIQQDIMDKKPINSKKGLFADGLWEKIFTEGVMIGALTLLAFSIGNNLYGLQVGRAMAFVSLSMLELIHSFNIKSEGSIFNKDFFKNKYLIGAFLVGAILQVGVISIPTLAKIFDVVPLNQQQWVYVSLVSISPIIIIEIQKKINEIKYGRSYRSQFQ